MHIRNLAMKKFSSACLALLLGAAALPYARALEVPIADDAQVLQTNPTYNYGGNTNLAVYSTSNAQRWSYLRFDPAAYLPDGYGASDVAQALVYLYPTSITAAGSIHVHRVTSGWNEGKATGAASAGTITWNNRPADNPVSLFTVQVASTALSDEFLVLDVTDLVKTWIADPSQNFGLVLKPGGTIVAVMDSRENTTTAHGPRLDITLKSKRVNPSGDVSMGIFTNGPQP